MPRGIVRDKKGNLKGIFCVVCGAGVSVFGGLIKNQPYCGRHYKDRANPNKRPHETGIINGQVVK